MSEKKIQDLIKKVNPNANFEHVELIKRTDNQNTRRFYWHAWNDINNIGAEGPKCGVMDVTIPRLTLMEITARRHNDIIPKIPGQSLPFANIVAERVGKDEYDAAVTPSAGSAANTKPRIYYPQEAIYELLTAYGQFGLVEFKSLIAQNEQELLRSYLVYNALFESRSEIYGHEEDGEFVGKPVTELLLEEFPVWLQNEAQDTLRKAASKPIQIDEKETYKPDSLFIPVGEKLITEVAESIKQSHIHALNDFDGILPMTKKLLNITANGGIGGKASLDKLDEWLMLQFPSFKMDTDVERNRIALEKAIGNRASSNDDTVRVLIEQNKKQSEQIDKLLTLIGSGNIAPATQTKKSVEL